MIRTCLVLFAAAWFVSAQPGIAQSQDGRPQPAAKPVVAVATTVNINTASASELDSLPGVGAKTAARIIEYRQKNGQFKKIEDVMNVRGMGEKVFLKLKPRLTVGTPKTEAGRP